MLTDKQKRNLKKKLRSIADELWHRCCLKEWGNLCFFHKHKKQSFLHYKIANSCHHIKNKESYGILRYDFDNGLVVCWPCHNKLEQEDSSMMEDVIKYRGKEWYDRLEEKAKNKKTSFETIEWYTENIIRMKKYLNEPVSNCCIHILKNNV